MSCDCNDNNLLDKPFYTHPCSEVKEDHARHIIVHQYVGCIRIANNWAVPTNDSSVWLSIPAMTDMLVGSVLWNPEFGRFRITAFDAHAQRVQVQRVVVEGTALPGTVVPICTRFIITDDHD